MFLTLLLFAATGSALGALTGVFGFGGEGLLLGASAGFVAGVMLWVLLWIGYQRFAPSLLIAEEEYRPISVRRVR